MNHRYKRILAAIVLGLLFSSAFSVIRGYYNVFENRKGLLLSNNEILGGDYIAFYTGGSLYRENKKDLYNFTAQKKWQDSFAKKNNLTEEIRFLPFVYPPLIAFFFSFLSQFSYETSYWLWTMVSILLAFLSIELILRVSSQKNGFITRALLYLIFLGYFPFSIKNIAGGQLASIGLLTFSLSYFFFIKSKMFLAGLSLFFASYKPPVFLFFTVFMSIKNIRFLRGVTIAVVLFLLLSSLISGIEIHIQYLSSVLNYITGDVPVLGNQLPLKLNVSIWSGLISGNWDSVSWFFVVISLLTLLAIKLSKYQKNRTALFISYQLLSLLFSFQLNVYDLSICLFPFMCALGCIVKGSTLRIE